MSRILLLLLVVPIICSADEIYNCGDGTYYKCPDKNYTIDCKRYKANFKGKIKNLFRKNNKVICAQISVIITNVKRERDALKSCYAHLNRGAVNALTGYQKKAMIGGCMQQYGYYGY